MAYKLPPVYIFWFKHDRNPDITVIFGSLMIEVMKGMGSCDPPSSKKRNHTKTQFFRYLKDILYKGVKEECDYYYNFQTGEENNFLNTVDDLNPLGEIMLEGIEGKEFIKEFINNIPTRSNSSYWGDYNYNNGGATLIELLERRIYLLPNRPRTIASISRIEKKTPKD